MFSDNSMLSFDDLQIFQNFYSALIYFGKWRITDKPVNKRGDEVRNSNYMKFLRQKFDEKHLFRWQVSIAELISIVDGLFLMNKFADKFKENYGYETYSKLSLFCEYRIKLSKNKRVDFILGNGSKILLLELRISNTFPNLSNIWHKKAYELLIYKEMMSYYLSPEIKIHNYSFIAMPEYTGVKGKEPVKKHIEYNNNNVNHLCKFVKEYLF